MSAIFGANSCLLRASSGDTRWGSMHQTLVPIELRDTQCGLSHCMIFCPSFSHVGNADAHPYGNAFSLLR